MTEMLEIERLDEMLTEAGIKHSFVVTSKAWKTWRTIWVPGDEPDLKKQRFSVIQHSRGSFGCDEGLCEFWNKDNAWPDSVPRTAQECFDEIREAMA